MSIQSFIRANVEPTDLNKYRTRRQYIHRGWCYLFDGLVTLLSLGSYQGVATNRAVEQMLTNAYQMRKTERNDPFNSFGGKLP